MNYYEILNVGHTATPEEIRRAYRELVEIHHPDRMQALRTEVQERAATQLKSINEAYSILRDPARRAWYDSLLKEPQAEPGGSRPVVQPGEATSALTRRLNTVEQEIAAMSGQIAQLRGREPEMRRLDQRWNRYQFSSIMGVLLFVFTGAWAALVWAAAPTSLPGVAALGGLLLFGYIALLLVIVASGGILSLRSLLRLLMVPPLLVLGLVVSIVLGLPTTVRLLLLLAGYALLVWQGVGRPLAEQRDEVSIQMSRMARLQETLYEYQIEERALRTELSHRQR
jgi:hypothetical protein